MRAWLLLLGLELGHSRGPACEPGNFCVELTVSDSCAALNQREVWGIWINVRNRWCVFSEINLLNAMIWKARLRCWARLKRRQSGAGLTFQIIETDNGTSFAICIYWITVLHFGIEFDFSFLNFSLYDGNTEQGSGNTPWEYLVRLKSLLFNYSSHRILIDPFALLVLLTWSFDCISCFCAFLKLFSPFLLYIFYCTFFSHALEGYSWSVVESN